MEDLKNENANVENVNIAKDEKIAIVKKAKKAHKESEAKLNKTNLSKFADRIKKFGVTEKTVSNNQKSLLYHYPVEFTSLQINGQQGKNFRSALRKKLRNFADQITLAEKMGNKEKKNEEIKKFNSFYKETFKVNDYSIASITHVKGEISDYYQLMLDIIIDSNSSLKTSKKAK